MSGADNRPPNTGEGIRLQRVLAQAGVGSRRACEVFIDEGRVSVDGSVVLEQGRRVDPEKADIRVDGQRIVTNSTAVYMIVNKEKGVVSTMADEQGRRSVGDYVATRADRLFHVGRLDADTEGLLLLTNDGDLAHRLAHPSFGVPKTYLATVPAPVARDVGRRLRAGIDLDDGIAKVDSFRMLSSESNLALVEIILHEGRTHIVRRLLDAVGHPVQRLVRTQMGPIALGSLKPGRTRHLTRHEVAALYQAVDL